MPGYGWVFPLGDGFANVGAIYLTSTGRWRGGKTFDLMDRYVDEVAASWKLSDRPVGPNWVLAGDAAGMINPFTGEGISYALETGWQAAEAIHGALRADDLTLLNRYPKALSDLYGPYFALARQFTRIIGRPEATRRLAWLAVRSDDVAAAAVRVSVMTGRAAKDDTDDE